MYEPWHIRYLGVDKATAVYIKKKKLEEHLGIALVYSLKMGDIRKISPDNTQFFYFTFVMKYPYCLDFILCTTANKPTSSIPTAIATTKSKTTVRLRVTSITSISDGGAVFTVVTTFFHSLIL